MKLIDYKRFYDYGWEIYINFLASKRFNFAQFYFGWDDFGSLPCLTINFLGNCQIISIYLRMNKLSLQFDFLCYYPRLLCDTRIK